MMTKQEIPGKVTAIAIMSIVSGAVSILSAVTLLFLGFLYALTIIGLILTIFLWIPPIPLILLGIFNILHGAKLLSGKARSPNKLLPILDIVSIIFCNFIALVLGIINLVFYSDPEVEAYFNQEL